MRPHRSTLIAVPAALAVLFLAGCVPTDGQTPAPTSSATSKPSPSASPSTGPQPSASAGAGTPVTITCDELISPQAIYDFNPNFALQSDFSPAAGSLAAAAVARGGIACSWINLTSSETFVFSVEHPSEADATATMNGLIGSSNSVPTYGVEGYFTRTGDEGVAHAFPLPYWVTAVSPMFLEPGDVTPLMTAAIAALG